MKLLDTAIPAFCRAHQRQHFKFIDVAFLGPGVGHHCLPLPSHGRIRDLAPHFYKSTGLCAPIRSQLQEVLEVCRSLPGFMWLSMAANSNATASFTMASDKRPVLCSLIPLGPVLRCQCAQGTHGFELIFTQRSHGYSASSFAGYCRLPSGS